jgi:hypothetical protein
VNIRYVNGKGRPIDEDRYEVRESIKDYSLWRFALTVGGKYSPHSMVKDLPELCLPKACALKAL